MHQTKLIWITPDAQKTIVEIARVSNPKNQFSGQGEEKLLKYLIDNQHWSPFEMASACIEINTTRDIARQILRHRSFHFQEFSQRYAEVQDAPVYREARLQDTKNRQNSLETTDFSLHSWWKEMQQAAIEQAQHAYDQALKAGIAKEVARVVLPEGMTPSKMYMAGTIRDWYHYCNLRMGNGTQKEHQEIAAQCHEILSKELPAVFL